MEPPTANQTAGSAPTVSVPSSQTIPPPAPVPTVPVPPVPPLPPVEPSFPSLPSFSSPPLPTAAPAKKKIEVNFLPKVMLAAGTLLILLLFGLAFYNSKSNFLPSLLPVQAPAEPAKSTTPSALKSASPSPSKPASPSLSPTPSASASAQLNCTQLGKNIVNPSPNTQVTFTCKATAKNTTLHHFNFRVNQGTTQKVSAVLISQATGQYQGTYIYTIPAAGGTFTVQCQVCRSADNSACTEWGKAQ